MSESGRNTAAAIGISVATVLIVCLILLARDPMFFWVCDYQLWFSGLFEDIARAWNAGEWPILSSGSWAVPSLAGEYQCATFSLFFNLCLVLIWKLPLTLAGKAATLSIVHLSVLAAGATALARERGISAHGSVLVGIVASLNGWIINWAATEWFAALGGFVWVPWSWWALEVALKTANRRVRWLLPAPFVYLTISAGSPFAVLMLALVSAWLACRTLIVARSVPSILPLVFAWCAGLGLSAPAWLTLIEYYRFSTRSEWHDMVQWSWTVPWRAWLGLALPSYITEWPHWVADLQPHFCIEMAGGLVPLAAVVGSASIDVRQFFRRWKWELLLLLLAVVLVTVPSIGSFRWSFRSMPLVHLTLALLGAACLDQISSRRISIGALALAAFASVIALSTQKNADSPFLVIQLGALTLWAIITMVVSQPRLKWAPAGMTAGLLLATYFSLSTRQGVSRHEFRENLLDPAPLDPHRLYLSVHSFVDILRGAHTPGWGAILRPCNTVLSAPLHFLNGYSSFTLRGVPIFFETHGSLQPQTVDALLGPECVELLDLLGVDGLVFGPDYLDRTSKLTLEWQLAYASEEGRIFHRDPARYGAAKTLRRIDSRAGQLLARPEIEVVRNGRQEVVVEVKPFPPADSDAPGEIIPSLDPSRPAAIAFSRPYLPGYRATLNKKELPVIAYQDYLPVVELPPGASGTLVLTYRPDSLRSGLLAATASAAILMIFACWPRRPRNRK